MCAWSVCKGEEAAIGQSQRHTSIYSTSRPCIAQFKASQFYERPVPAHKPHNHFSVMRDPFSASHCRSALHARTSQMESNAGNSVWVRTNYMESFVCLSFDLVLLFYFYQKCCVKTRKRRRNSSKHD